MNDNSKLAKPIRSLTSLVRPKYSPGLLLQDDDLTAAVSYTRNLSRLMFRTLFGCGVLCGLRVGVPRLDDKCGDLVTDIDKGVALSCEGDPIEVSASEVKIDTCENELPCFLWFAVRHIESSCVPRTAQCSPDEEEPTPASTRERDGFEIRVFPERPPCSCGCKKLTPPPDPQSITQLNFVVDALAEKAKLAAASKKSARKVVQAIPAVQPAPATPPAVLAPSSGCIDPETVEKAPTETVDPCKCNLRTGPDSCYEAFYQGECACDCCDCEWIILAVASRQDEKGEDWKIDHSVRRFVRPVLMRDWVVEQERKAPQGS
jgi:hypothetical protein